MRRVKLLMIARHILAGLWLLVWLTASPAARACVANSDVSAPALASTDGQGNPHADDLAGVHFRVLRASRRLDVQSVSTDPLVGFFDARTAWQHDLIRSQGGSEASIELASSWQFLLRTALSPRSPSFVS